MTYNIVYERIKDSLDTIFAYSLKRTDNRHEAEDLSQEIILNLYSSVHTLKDPERFYGWMWALAGNVYKGYLRKKQKNKFIPLEDSLFIRTDSYEQDIIFKEEVGILYRELSILAGLYRECMVHYYLNEKSCDEIAELLKISQEMVKQYLFKSRRKVKDGMAMIRETGEKSVNPKKFNIYAWGDGGNYCAELFRRKLPGNIMLETYYEPVTIEQLSVELGVSSVYLEDELNILLTNGLIKKIKTSKFQSNIVIFTNEFEVDLAKKTKELYQDIANRLYNFISDNEVKIRDIAFNQNFKLNTILWQVSTLCLTEVSVNWFLKQMLKEVTMPVRSNGNRGFMWGLEKKYGDSMFDLGIGGFEDENRQLRHVDFAAFEKKFSCLWNPKIAKRLAYITLENTSSLTADEQDDLIKLMEAGFVTKKDECLKINLPILTAEQFNDLLNLLKPMLDELKSLCKDQMNVTEQLLRNFIPTYLKDQINVISCFKVVESFITKIMEALYQNGHITYTSNENELLTTLVVIK